MGCAASVRGALTAIEGISDIQTDPTAQTCSFSTTNPDIENLLATAAENNAHLKDYTIQ